MILLRNLAFYPAFYVGSIRLVIAAVLAIPLGATPVSPIRPCLERLSPLVRAGVPRYPGPIEGEIPPGAVFFAIKHESFFEAIDAPNLFHLPVPFAKDELFRIPGWGIVAQALRTDSGRASGRGAACCAKWSRRRAASWRRVALW